MSTSAEETAGKALAIFDIQQGPLSVSKVPVPAPVVTIGQSAVNEVVLADDSISRRHARLEYEAGSWHVTDLDSTNGTYLNGTRVPPNVATPLPYGANIRFGAVLARFRATGSDLEAERARYTPPPSTPRVADRRSSGFRFPLWVLLLILVIATLAILLVNRGAATTAAIGPSEPILALAEPVTLSS
jgi:pSer/pThr/pTyr-binding forkhead associated (FHA) protein